MVHAFEAGAVRAHVVAGPAATELLAPGGQLPDQIRELRIVGLAAGLGPQQAVSYIVTGARRRAVAEIVIRPIGQV
jgi:hypothetical protein